MPVDAEVLAGIGMFFIDMETYFSQEKKQKVSFSDDTLPNMKDLYDRYKQCRDFELERFWKNSTFVWCFLTLCFGALGFLVSKYLEDVNKCKIDFYIITSVLSFFGGGISYVWVLMAQGLKAWYKVFEHVIWRMENVDNIFGYDKKFLLEKFYSATKDGCLQGRPYSPSKIVVLIGYLLMIFWCVIFLLNILATFNVDCGKVCLCCVIYVIECVLFIWFYRKSPCWIKSSSLRNLKEQELYEKIRFAIQEKGLICNWVEVTGSEVKFSHTRASINYISSKIKEYFDISELKMEDNCICYCRADFENYFGDSNRIKTIEKELRDKKIPFLSVYFCNGVCISYDKEVYDKNIPIISEILKKIEKGQL